MSDEKPDETQGQSPAELREYAKRMKAEADAAKEDLVRAAADRRKLLKYEAGLADLDDERFAALGEGDAAALHAKAESWGWLAKPGDDADPEPDDGPTEQEKAHADASKSLRSEGTPPGEEPSPDPVDARRYREARESGQTHDAAVATYFTGLFDAASNGDARAIVK